MKIYLSYGGGINSTAMMIMLHNQNIKFEAVFADHGGDYPETYKYVDMLIDKGYPITVLKTREIDLDLYDYSLHYKVFPSRQLRWCTDRFKIKPMYKYFKKPCKVYIGFDANEWKRAKPSANDEIENEFPLIDEGIDRKGCEQIIRDAGLPIPIKSGCYFCPFQRISGFKHLRDNYPNLWCKTKKMEQLSNERRIEKKKELIYIKDKPLDVVVNEGQDDLFGWRKPCQCGL